MVAFEPLCSQIWVVLGGVGEAGQLSLIGVAFEPLCGGSTVSISGGDSYCNGGVSSGEGDSTVVLMMVAVPAVFVEACYLWCYWW